MIEATEIKKEELQEMARVILCEIYGAAKSSIKLKGAEHLETEGSSDLRLSEGADSLERPFTEYGDLNNLRRRYVENAPYEEAYPRLKRGDFWEQRLLRHEAKREQRGADNTAASVKERNTQMRPGKLSQADLPERLSDIFCKDARRYDGAFERY